MNYSLEDLTINDYKNPMRDWDRVFEIKDLLNKELEKLRIQKLVGSSEECRIRLHLTRQDLENIYYLTKSFREVFKVSQVDVVESEEFKLDIEVIKGKDGFEKCPRCWLYHPFKGENYADLCDRCCESILQGWSHEIELCENIKNFRNTGQNKNI